MQTMKHKIKLTLGSAMGIAVLLCLPFPGNGAVPTTRQQTILPVAIPAGTPEIAPSNVPLYAVYGYSTWQWGPGTNEGRKFDLMPAGYAGSGNAARLLSFFSISDTHITDKESPAQGLYYGWSAPFGAGGIAAAYSPVILSTTHILNDAVKAVNALHSQTPFDFGIFLGDACNNSQFNELRWYIDVIDGGYITPSSGAHLGAEIIGYQKPYQAAGLNRSIPWYQVIGNHDQFWSGVNYIKPKLLDALVGTNIINMGTNFADPAAVDLTDAYMGVVDGTTRYGDVIGAGLTNTFATPPTVVADTNRRSLATTNSPNKNWMGEFFDTASSPVGHGFTQINLDDDFACYTFEPLTNLPIKVIVLDNTAKSNNPAAALPYYASGSIDSARYAWLTNELQKGQDAEQLMILAAHVPINPQQDLFDTNSAPQFFAPLSFCTDAQLIATLHNYPNLILLVAGHRHKNTVTPQPSPDPDHPEYGFWEVETASLRDFPQQFRTFDIRRNNDNSISILTTCVDPQVETNTPAADSRGYAVGTARIFGDTSPTDTTAHTYNAELVKQLTPAMRAKIARLGDPLQLGGHDYDGDGKSDPTVFSTDCGVFSMFLSGDNYDRFIAPIPMNVTTSAIGVLPIPGDFDGDGQADPAVYDPITGRWMVLFSSQPSVLQTLTIGDASCVPVSGDFDADGKADPALYSAAVGQMAAWLSDSGYAMTSTPMGGAGWLNASADYDGDGKTDPGVYHPASGTWMVLLSATAYAPASGVTMGGAGCVPVAADYDGDGKADLMVYQPAGGFWQCTFSAQGYTITQSAAGFGGPTMLAVAGGDYDNDGKADPAVYDPVTRTFYVMLPGSNYSVSSLHW